MFITTPRDSMSDYGGNITEMVLSRTRRSSASGNPAAFVIVDVLLVLLLFFL